MMLVMIHGDKGGVGKSMTAALLLDSLLAAGASPVLVEGDSTSPDVAWRYPKLDRAAAINLNRSGDATAAMMKLVGWLDAHARPADTIIVNLPAGAGATIDDLAADFVETVVKPAGHELVVTYNVGPSRVSADGLAQSLETGLVGAADRAFVIRPLFLAARESFFWSSHPSRAGFFRRFGDAKTTELDLPAIDPDALRDRIGDIAAPLSVIARDPEAGLDAGERWAFGRWLRQCHPLTAAILAAPAGAGAAPKRGKANA